MILLFLARGFGPVFFHLTEISMSLYRQFKSDANLEKTGILIQYGFVQKPDGQPDLERPISFRIARAGGSNTPYHKRVEAKVKPYRRQIQTETIDPKVAENLMLEVFCETVLLGWENVQDENGQDIEFTKDNAMKLFTDLPDLYKDLQEQANKAALFRAEIREGEAGN